MEPLAALPILQVPTATYSLATGSAAPGTPAANSKETAQHMKLRHAAQEFEAILINSWWQSMKESFSSLADSEEEPAHGTLEDWSMQAMSSAIAASGGVGLGNMLVHQLEPAAASSPAVESAKDEYMRFANDH